MLDALTITEAEAAGLCELAALDLAMAKDFAARAQAAEDPAVANDLARSYQRVARSYRQTLALKMRLAREIAQAEREAQANPPPFDARAAGRRLNELRSAVAHVAFTEYEGPEREDELRDILGLLDEVLVDHAADIGFAQRPLDDQVAEVCVQLDLSPEIAARWRDLPDPSDPPAPRARTEPKPPWRDTG